MASTPIKSCKKSSKRLLHRAYEISALYETPVLCMRPSQQLLKLLALWLLLAFALAALRLLHAEILPAASAIWWSIGGALLAIAAIDALRRKLIDRIEVQRNLPAGFN